MCPIFFDKITFSGKKLFDTNFVLTKFSFFDKNFGGILTVDSGFFP